MKRTFPQLGLLLALVVLAGCSRGTSNAATTAAASQMSTATALPAPACTPRPAGQPAAAPVAPPSLYLSSDDGFVYALDGTTGSARWKVGLSPSSTGRETTSGTLVLDQQVLYVSTSDNTVSALDASDGTLRWGVDCPGAGLGVVAPVVSNGVVYVAGTTTLYALRTSDGKEVWHQQIGVVDPLPFAVDGDAIYVNARDATSGAGMVVALSAATGAQRWSVVVEGVSDAAPLGADGAVYVSASSATGPDGSLYALNASDGAQRWRLQEQGSMSSLARDQDLLYGLLDSGSLLAIKTADGSQRWQVPAPATVLTAANGMLYLGAQGTVNPTVSPTGTVTALSAATGAQRWRASIQGGSCGCATGLVHLHPASGAIGISRPLVFNGMVAVWLGGVISTLDATTGKVLWQATVGTSQAFLVAG